MSKEKMQEMGIKAKVIWTIALGLVCVAIIVTLIWDPFSGCLVEDKVNFSFGENSIESTYRYFDYQYALQWFALGCFIFMLWLWREKLGIDGLGPVHGSKDPEIKTDLNSTPIENGKLPTSVGDEKTSDLVLTKGDTKISVLNKQEYGGQEKETLNENSSVGSEKMPASVDVKASSDLVLKKGDAKISVLNKQEYRGLEKETLNENSSVECKKEALPVVEKTSNKYRIQEAQNKRLESFYKKTAEVFNVYKKISVENLAKMVGVSTYEAYRMLRSKRDLYRLDGEGIKSVVTKYNSEENIVLNKLYEELTVNGSVLQYREAVVDNYRVDAIFRSATDIYVVSLKTVNVSENKNIVGKEVSLLNKVSMKFSGVKRHLVIVFIGFIDERRKIKRMEALQKHCRSFSNLEIKFMDPQSLG